MTTVVAIPEPSTFPKPPVDADALQLRFYEDSLAKDRLAFKASLIAAAAGFALIAAGAIDMIVTGLTVSDGFAGMGGVVLEAISTLFIKQARESSRQNAEFLDRLRSDNALVNSAEVTERIRSDAVRDKVRAVTALRMVDPDATDELIAEVLG